MLLRSAEGKPSFASISPMFESLRELPEGSRRGRRETVGLVWFGWFSGLSGGRCRVGPLPALAASPSDQRSRVGTG